MLDIRDFILLKAIFNETLHNAVMKEDKNWVKAIIIGYYTMECYEGFIQGIHGIYSDETYKTLSSIDLHEIRIQHEKDLKEDLSWAY